MLTRPLLVELVFEWSCDYTVFAALDPSTVHSHACRVLTVYCLGVSTFELAHWNPATITQVSKQTERESVTSSRRRHIVLIKVFVDELMYSVHVFPCKAIIEIAIPDADAAFGVFGEESLAGVDRRSIGSVEPTRDFCRLVYLFAEV